MDIDQLIATEGLYQTQFDDGTIFVWRLLSRKEHKVLRGLRDSGVITSDYAASEAFSRCIVTNAALLSDNQLAGYEVSIGNLIMYLSGDCSVDQIQQDIALIRERYPQTDIYEYMKRLICTAYPAYRPNELDEMSRMQLIKLFNTAEAMMQAKIPEFKPLELKDIIPFGQKTTQAPVDFAKENLELQRAMSGPTQDNGAERNLSPRQVAQLHKMDRMRNR